MDLEKEVVDALFFLFFCGEVYCGKCDNHLIICLLLNSIFQELRQALMPAHFTPRLIWRHHHIQLIIYARQTYLCRVFL